MSYPMVEENLLKLVHPASAVGPTVAVALTRLGPAEVMLASAMVSDLPPPVESLVLQALEL